MIIGYARVSTRQQTVENQVAELTAAGCEKIFSDIMSGKGEYVSQRNGLKEAIDFVREGDTLMVWRLDRFARSCEDLLRMVRELDKKGVKFKSLKDTMIDTSGATGILVLQFMAAIAEFERNLLIERQAAGINRRRTSGIGATRPFRVNHEDFNTLMQILPGNSLRGACRTLKISPASLYRYCDRNNIPRSILTTYCEKPEDGKEIMKKVDETSGFDFFKLWKAKYRNGIMKQSDETPRI